MIFLRSTFGEGSSARKASFLHEKRICSSSFSVQIFPSLAIQPQVGLRNCRDQRSGQSMDSLTVRSPPTLANLGWALLSLPATSCAAVTMISIRAHDRTTGMAWPMPSRSWTGSPMWSTWLDDYVDSIVPRVPITRHRPIVVTGYHWCYGWSSLVQWIVVKYTKGGSQWCQGW